MINFDRIAYESTTEYYKSLAVAYAMERAGGSTKAQAFEKAKKFADSKR